MYYPAENNQKGLCLWYLHSAYDTEKRNSTAKLQKIYGYSAGSLLILFSKLEASDSPLGPRIQWKVIFF